MSVIFSGHRGWYNHIFQDCDIACNQGSADPCLMTRLATYLTEFRYHLGHMSPSTLAPEIVRLKGIGTLPWVVICMPNSIESHTMKVAVVRTIGGKAIKIYACVGVPMKGGV